jgi:hypothetical protein
MIDFWPERDHRGNPIGVVADKCCQTLRWRPSKLRHVFGDRSLADVDAKLEQFTMAPGSAPKRIGQAHLADQFPDFERDLGTASGRARFPSPKLSKTDAMPTDDGLRLDSARAFTMLGAAR